MKVKGMARWKRTLGAWLLCAALPGTAWCERFDFVALGDTAYEGAADDRAYAALVDRINRQQPAFTIHVGDVWGGTACQDEDHRRIHGWFMRYEQPLVYTPGDNEWTDCVDPKVLAAYERIEAGQAQPDDAGIVAAFRQLPQRAVHSGRWALASLERIRRIQFDAPRSLGRTPMPLQRQSELSDVHRQMVENARWRHGGVVFATVHVVGSMNGLSISDPEAAAEAVRRNQANVAWIQDTVAEARRTDAKALVLAMHASIFDRDPPAGRYTGRTVRGGRQGPYALVAAALQEAAAGFGKPVLMIHGDDHEFMVDRPFLVAADGKNPAQGANLMRLQVFGAPEIRAVRIGVDTDTPGVFTFSPLYAE